MKINLTVDTKLPPSTNIFLFGTYLREEVSNNQQIEIVIPRSLFIQLSKSDYNEYFSDILIDKYFDESNIIIKIKDINHFQINFEKPI